MKFIDKIVKKIGMTFAKKEDSYYKNYINYRLKDIGLEFDRIENKEIILRKITFPLNDNKPIGIAKRDLKKGEKLIIPININNEFLENDSIDFFEGIGLKDLKDGSNIQPKGGQKEMKTIIIDGESVEISDDSYNNLKKQFCKSEYPKVFRGLMYKFEVNEYGSLKVIHLPFGGEKEVADFNAEETIDVLEEAIKEVKIIKD